MKLFSSRILVAVLAVSVSAFWCHAGTDSDSAAGEEELVTAFFDLPAGLLTAPGPARFHPNPQQILEDAGMVFGAGSSARMLDVGPTGRLVVRNTREQIDFLNEWWNSLKGRPATQITVIVEFIETERAALNQWLGSNDLDSDGTELRRLLQQWVRKREAKVVETIVVSACSGIRAKVESVSEIIYPTEYDVEFIPKQKVGEEVDPAEIEPPPLIFETREAGITVEVDPVLGADESTVDVDFSNESVALTAYTTWPHEAADPEAIQRRPTFHSMDIVSAVSLTDGHYEVIGTLRPPHAVQEDVDDPVVVGFVRADINYGRRMPSKN